MINSPLVSVIVPAYNAERFIARTLNSVLSQTYKNLEVIVVDDGSQDRTSEIVKYFVQQDSRVILLQQDNAGVAAARNLAIAKSRGEYIAPIDADDIWYPQKLEKQVQCLGAADKSVGLVYAWSVSIDEDDLILSDCNYEYSLAWHSIEGKVYPALIYSNFIGNASVPLIRKVCFDEIGSYNCELKAQNAQGGEDWDLYLRMAEYYEFQVVKDFLVGYRQVDGSMSSNYKSMAKSYYLVMKECQIRHPEIPSYIYKLSSSQFKLYLAFKSGSCGKNWDTLVLLVEAIILDYYLLLHSWIYKSLVLFILKVIAQPIKSLFWNDYDFWVQFRKRFMVRRNKTIIAKSVISKNYSENDTQPKNNINLSEKIKLQRWLRVLQLCQQFEYSLHRKSKVAVPSTFVR